MQKQARVPLRKWALIGPRAYNQHVLGIAGKLLSCTIWFNCVDLFQGSQPESELKFEKFKLFLVFM